MELGRVEEVQRLRRVLGDQRFWMNTTSVRP